MDFLPSVFANKMIKEEKFPYWELNQEQHVREQLGQMFCVYLMDQNIYITVKQDIQ